MMNALLPNQSQGHIKPCPHCQGTGHCNVLYQFYRRPDQILPRWQEVSCLVCRTKAGLPEHRLYGDLICYVCQGKGLVWVGPEIVGHR